ncbi:MAG: PIG-L family deacetylase, partial [Anaerolineaceae bacterium]
MAEQILRKKILVVLAHPDDESYGMGGTLAKYSRYGAQIVLLCATRGEAGILGVEPDDAGKIREKELLKAAEYLGVQVFFLGYHDGELSSSALNTLTKDIGGWIYAVEPDLIFT